MGQLMRRILDYILAVGLLVSAVGWEAFVVTALSFGLLFSFVNLRLIGVVSRRGGEVKTAMYTLTVPTRSPPSPTSTARRSRASAVARPTPIADELRKLRQTREIPQGELAQLLNVAVAFISQVESGEAVLRRDQLERIVVEYGLAGDEAQRLRRALAKSRTRK